LQSGPTLRRAGPNSTSDESSLARSWHEVVTDACVTSEHTACIGLCACRLSPRLLALLERLAGEPLPIAEINRRVGAEAERLGMLRPSYSRIRTLTHEARARRRAPTTAQVLLEVSMRARPPEAVLDHISGIGVPPLRP
jgi:hypothetical protein